MARFAVFLRGMNVGGHRITNAELAAECEALGLAEVATFRASGNIVFETSLRSQPKITKLLEKGLERGLGYAVPTFVRSAGEVQAIASFEPFEPELIADSKGKLQVILLRAEPPATKRSEILSLATGDDQLVLERRELYWLPSGGTLDSELDWGNIDRYVGPNTTRTKGTMEQVAAKYFSDGDGS